MRARLARLLTATALITGCAFALGACGDATNSRRPATTTAIQQARIAPDFVGIVAEDSFAASGTGRRDILAGLKRTGVEVVRQVFDWSQIEKRRGQYDFGAHDAWIEAVARAGLDVLPVLFRPPRFFQAAPQPGAKVTATTTFPPRDMDAFARFAAAVAARYGPEGSYWASHPSVPRRPMRAWQIWNEPNLPAYWGGIPSAPAYVAMLRAAGAALHRVDPDAEVVTAGIPETRLGVPLKRYVRQLLDAGAKGAFDTFAVHPYAGSVDAVLAVVRLARGLLREAGDRAPIWLTEIGWASGGPRSSFTVGARRQASLVLSVITSLAQAAPELGVRGVVYFNWRDAKPYAGGRDFWGLHTGLLRLDGSGKPALSTYYQAAGVVRKLRAAQ